MKRTIFKDALDRADICIIQFSQVLYLIQTIDYLTDCRTVWTDYAATICNIGQRQLDCNYGTACRLRSDGMTLLLNTIDGYLRRLCSFTLRRIV